MKQAYDVWQSLSSSGSFDRVPMMLRCNRTGEIAASVHMTADDLVKASSEIQINECASILVPTTSLTPRIFAVVQKET